MKNRKGFTLIELLVTITIIGIIMIMTLPAIHNLQRENQKKKFDDYERAVLEAAKAYEDQYEEDLFGRSDTGCASINYVDLVNKKLLIRRLNIAACNLVDEFKLDDNKVMEQLDLFSGNDYSSKRIEKELETKERKVQDTIINIKNKYGKNSIIKGLDLIEGATAIDRNNQVGGHKA